MRANRAVRPRTLRVLSLAHGSAESSGAAGTRLATNASRVPRVCLANSGSLVSACVRLHLAATASAPFDTDHFHRARHCRKSFCLRVVSHEVLLLGNAFFTNCTQNSISLKSAAGDLPLPKPSSLVVRCRCHDSQVLSPSLACCDSQNWRFSARSCESMFRPAKA